MPAGTATVNNGAKKVNVYQLDPTVVTKANEKVAFKDDSTRLALLK